MKWFKRIGTLAAGLLIGTAALAQGYPNKPVRIVVAYQAGQGTDVVTRYLAEQLTRSLGQSFFIENRGGAGGNIGTEVVARAAADGYTLTMGTNATHALNQFLYAMLPFNAEKDFEPVILVGTFPMAVLAGVDSPIKSIEDLVARVKSNPRAADIALPSTTARLVYELLKERSQAPLFGVPYKGSSVAQSDVLGGQVPVMIDTVTAGRPLVASNKLRVLGVTSAKPTALMPGAKTVAEQGLPGFEVIAWNALYAPKGTPPAIVKQLNAEVAKILAQPETRQRLIELGFEPAGGTPEQLADFARSERDKWGPLIKKADIKAE